MITVYHVSGTRGIRPIWLCEELGLDYQIEKIEFSADFRTPQSHRDINPLGKVPAMHDDGPENGLLMLESGAMVQYLLDRYGQGRLQPKPGTQAHAEYLQWSWFAEATFSRPLGEIVNHRREFPGDKNIPSIMEEMSNRALVSADVVAAQVAHQPFLIGEEFSAADIMMGYTLLLAERMLAKGLPANLHDYWERLKQRPAMQIATG